jgi:hypothetical protein
LLPQEQQAITSEFSQLMPYANQQAAYTGEFNRAAASDAQNIFQQAGANLNTMQQNNAAQAQQMAQQIGGPVSTGQFTSALEPYQTAIAQGGSVAGLNALELGVVGTDEARQFSGQVLPAMAAEQHKSVALNIQDNIQKLRDQITTIQGTKSKLIDAKLPALLTAAHNYQIQEQALAQKKLDSKRSWDEFMKGLDYKMAALNLQGQHENFNEWLARQGVKQKWATVGQQGQVIKIDQEKVAQNWTALGIRDKTAQLAATKQAQNYKLGLLKYQALAGHYIREDANSQAKLAVGEAKNVGSLIDMALGGSTSNKPVTTYVRHYLSASDPKMIQLNRYKMDKAGNFSLNGKAAPFPTGVMYDKATGKFYTQDKVTETPQQFAQQNNMSGTPVTDPNALYRLVMETYPDINPNTAADAVRLRMGIPNWNPGDPLKQPAASTKTKPKGTGTVVNPTTALYGSGTGGQGQQTYNPPPSLASKLAGMTLSKLTDYAVNMGYPQSPKAATRGQLLDFIYQHQQHGS